MIAKIDTNSDEFRTQLELTEKFTDKVIDRFNFVYNPNNEVNEAIQMGLTRNKMIYGKRYCPCFMVEGETKEEQKAADNRLCPCKPALEKEIPKEGHCHCGIFCTEEFAKSQLGLKESKEELNKTSGGLDKQFCEDLLSKDEINSSELESLIEARQFGLVEFNLIDTREWMEWIDNRIKGTDYLIPTTSFYHAIEKEGINNQKDIPIVVYCLSGSRSASCQRVMRDLGYKSVTNLEHGISSFSGVCHSGE